MNDYVLGLDIGITSVGYGIVSAKEKKIIDAGVRLFEEGNAENNLKRRTKRSGRRLKRRKQNRLDDLTKYLETLGIIKEMDVNLHPLEIRIKGLSNKLSPSELYVALYHICKRRGTTLDTISDSEESSEEVELKDNLTQNQELVKAKYICEIQWERLNREGKYRGHHNIFKTEDYLKEVAKILDNQDLSETQKNIIIQIIGRRRKYYEGPGSYHSPTPYGRFIMDETGKITEINLIEKMLGHCSLFKEELRAPKMAYSSELFNLLNDLNNLTIDKRKITKEEKEKIIEHINKNGNLTIKQLLKFVETPLEEINGFRVNKKGEPILTEMKGYNKLRKLFKKEDSEDFLEDKEMLDQIAVILTRSKGIEERKEQIASKYSKLPTNLVEALANEPGFSNTHAYSLKALSIFIPELISSSKNQMEIIYTNSLLKELHQKGDNTHKLMLDEESAILSPVAKRAIREAFKVVNRLREQYGEFLAITVETTRSKNSKDEKEKIKKSQKFFEEQNKIALHAVKEYKSELTAFERMKVRLYMDQNGKCAYTGELIDIRLLLDDPHAYEVDHIIPRSISLDDSYNNQVLVMPQANQNKGNLTPYMAIKSHKLNVSWEQFQANIQAMRLSAKKKEYLLDQTIYSTFDTEMMKKFINRNLIDTSYANRVVMNTLKNYFNTHDIPTKVHTIRGSATSAFRKRIGKIKDQEAFDNKDREYYQHHAIDALLIASLYHQRNIYQALNSINVVDGLLFSKETGEVINLDAHPDDEYIEESYLRFVKEIVNYDVYKFSWKVDRKPNRSISDETIYSTRIVDNQEKVVKKYKNIYDAKFFDLSNDIINNNYQQKYLMAKHDEQTFAKIVAIVQHYYQEFKEARNDKGKPMITEEKGKVKFQFNPLQYYKDAHGQYITKYSKKGNGPVVKQMNYLDSNLGNYLSITHKYQPKNNKKVILLQISPYRSDFYVNDKNQYKFITIRRKDIQYDRTNKEYYIDEKLYQDKLKEKGIDESYRFLASFNRNEIIEITKQEKDEIISQRYRFIGTNNDFKNTIEVKPISYYEKKQLMPTIGKSIISIRKLTSDVVGNHYNISKEVLKLRFK